MSQQNGLKKCEEDGKTSCRLARNICKHICNQSLVSRIYTEFSKLNDNKKNQIKNKQKIETNISLKKIYRCQKST